MNSDEPMPIININFQKNILKVKNISKRSYCIIFFKMNNCAYCESFQPIFDAAKEKYKGNPSIELLMAYNTYMYNELNLIDAINKITSTEYKTLNVFGYPTIAVFESDPDYEYYYFCEIYLGQRDELDKYIENLINQS